MSNKVTYLRGDDKLVVLLGEKADKSSEDAVRGLFLDNFSLSQSPSASQHVPLY